MTAKQSGDPQNSEAGSATKRGAKKKSPRRKKTGRTIGPTPTRIESPYAVKTTKRPAKKQSPRGKKTGRIIGPTPTRIESPHAAKTTKRPAKKSRRQSKSIRLP